MPTKIDTHGKTLTFGKHNGELYTRVPVGYLFWMVQSGHSKAHIAQAEIDRRGAVLPTIEVSAHAINRASQCALDIWMRTRGEEEGLHTWLMRNAQIAYDKGLDESDRACHNGMRFVFQTGEWPVVKTVQRRKQEPQEMPSWVTHKGRVVELRPKGGDVKNVVHFKMIPVQDFDFDNFKTGRYVGVDELGVESIIWICSDDPENARCDIWELVYISAMPIQFTSWGMQCNI